MQAFGIVVIGVLIISVLVGLYAARNPPRWDEIGGGSPMPDEAAAPPSRFDDEADLRALVAAKRARRQQADGPTVASDGRPAEDRADWAHLDADVVSEARELVARRRARMERTGQPVPDERAELVRLLGPPYAP